MSQKSEQNVWEHISIKDFVVYPAAILDEKTKLSYMAIKSLKNRIPPRKVKTIKKTSTTKSTSAKTATTTTTKAKTPAKKVNTSNKTAKGRQTTLLDMTQKNKNSKSTTSKKKEDK